MWWKVNEIGIEYMNGSLNQDIKYGPLLRHFRSSSIADITNELTNFWEMCIRDNFVLPAYVSINSDGTKNLTNFFDDDHHDDFSISIQCEPLTGEEEEEEVYNCDGISVDVTEMDNVSLHIVNVDCTDPVHFTASKGGYNISTPKKNMQYQTHSTPPSISPIQNDMQAVYITKEANILHIILGSNELVLAIDKAKIYFKNFPPDDYLRSKYLDILAQIQTLILRTETKLKNELTAWEVEFVKKQWISCSHIK